MFSGINIESSATCNLKCVVCPTTSYSPDARRGYLKPEILDYLLPLPHGMTGSAVDLTGWGEPLLNPHLPDILSRIPGATFTTNATLLDDRWAERIIKHGISAVAFSIDAAGAETYTRLHGGGDSEMVWRNLKQLRRMRDEARADLPLLSAHFLLMKSNLGELVEFVDRAADAGMDEVLIKHVALFARPSQIDEALFTGFFINHEVDTNRRDGLLTEAGLKARNRGIRLRRAGADHAHKVANCFGGALERPFVSWDGKVSPCCVLAHSVTRIAPDGSMAPGPETFFGDLKNDSLEQIWNREDYVAHRKAIADNKTPDACKHCFGLWSVTVEPVL